MRLFSYFFFVALLHLSYKRDISYFLCNPFFRSSHWRCSVKSNIPKKFHKFHMKRPMLGSLFNNVAAWHCNFTKNRLQHWFFQRDLRNFLEHIFYRTSANDCLFFFFQIRFSRFNCISRFKFETG